MTPGHSWESFGPRQRRPEEEWALRLLPLLVCLSLPAFSLIFVKGPAGWRSEGGSSNVARGPFDRAAHNAMRAATAPRSLSPTPDPRHNLIPLRQERAPGRDSGSSWLRLHSNLWDVEIVMFYFCAGGRGGGCCYVMVQCMDYNWAFYHSSFLPQSTSYKTLYISMKL